MTFKVVPSGTAPFSFQWYRTGKAVAGATNSSYSFVAQAADDGTVFSVGVTNVAGTTMSQATLTVDVPPSITQAPGNQTIAAGQSATFAVTATGTAPLTYQWFEGGTAIAGATASTFTTPAESVAQNGDSFTVQVSNMAGKTTSAAATVSVTPLTPALSFAPIAAQTYGGQPFTVSATSASNGPVTYSVVSGPATVAGSTVTVTGTGTIVLAANQVASGNYAGATAQASFSVASESPTLSFASIPAQTYGGQPFQVNATSASSGAVTYSVVSGPATLSGNTVTVTGTGTVVLAASQAASGNFAAATAQATFSVGTETPTLTFAAIPTQTYGGQPVQVSATSASSGAVTYSVVSGPATVSGNIVTTTGTGTVVLSASQAATGNFAAAAAQTTFSVGTETPSLAFAPIPGQTYGGQPFTVSATSASTGAVTYSVVSGPATISGNTVTTNGAGTVVLAATQAASGNYAAANAQTSFSVGNQTPTLSFTTIPNQTFGGQPFTVNATSASSGAVTYSVVSGPATVSGNTVTTNGTGTVVLAASQAANGNYAAANAQTSFTVGAQAPTLSFATIPNQTYGGQPFTVNATSASSGAVTYSVVSGPATVSGNTVTVNGTGTVVLAASQAANGNYGAASTQTSFSVGVQTPTLTFAAIPSQAYGGQPIQVSATSASSGAVMYSVVSGPATVSGNTVTTNGTGTVVLAANQAASGNYGAANAQTSFSVGAASTTLTFAAIPSQTYGNPPVPVSATSASSGQVTYSVVSGPATVSGNTVTLTGAGTVTLAASQAATANYAGSTAQTSFTVAPEGITLVFAKIPSQTYGNQPFQVSATSASSGAVTYSVVSGPVQVSGNTVTITGAGPVTLAANQAADGNYAAGSVQTSFTVAAASPTLSFANIPAQTYGGQPFQVSATSASAGAVTYSVLSGPATISGNTVTLTGAGPVTLSATQAATANYTSASAQTSVTAAAATPTLAFAAIPAQTYGGQPIQVSATSASTGAVTYSVVSGPATISGNTVTITGTGSVQLSASQAADANYTSATAATTFTVAAATPNLAFATIPQQTYGGAALQVSATSASSGAVTYSVVSGPATVSGNTVTFTGTGTVKLSASQAATANYAAATAQTNFAVGPATPTLTFASIPAQTYGNPSFTVSATSASSGAVTYAVVSGPATISGSTVTLTGAGTVVLQANQASSADGNYTSASTTVSVPVASNVAITPISPANATIAPGQQTYTATATGGVTNNLNWTATGGSFSGNVWTAPNTVGTYTITATSADEPSVSVATKVTVSAPVITSQPVSKNACAGYNPSFTTGANYATSYQWFKNGNSLGITTPTLTFPNVTVASSGNYSCTAINGAGSVSTNVVTLNVVTPTTLAITSQPSSVTVYATQTATFSAGVSGTGMLAYQWYTGTPGSGTAIAGATSSSYTTGALTSANSGATYYVTISDPDCTGSTVTSNAAILTVSTTDTAVPPTIVVQPQGETATIGGTATFSVTASGSGTLAYQWFRVPFSSTQLSNPTAGVLIANATSSTYTVPASATAQSNDGDNYYVVVTNAYGQAVSSRVVLAVGAGIVLQLNSEPQSQYIAANSLASFSVSATCTGCTPAYQWYWYAPGSSTATILKNGLASSSALTGATITGATASSITLQNVPTTATGGTFYVVVTSTSDGSSQISGTNPLTSNTAGLFVGSLGTIGNGNAGGGLCNGGLNNWVLNGNTPGQTAGSVPYQNASACTIQLVNDKSNERSAVYWPTLISTAKFTISFTVAMSAAGTPADGFTLVLADPSQGATTSTIGAVGEGIGANGVPGFVLGFDTYQNGTGNGGSGCIWSGNIPCDPAAVPYMAVGQGATALWENPWTFVNGSLDTQNSRNYTPAAFANSTHSYVVNVVNKVMTVTMDGYELFTGTVSLPPAAYLGFTASTGGSEESVTVSNVTATVSAP